MLSLSLRHSQSNMVNRMSWIKLPRLQKREVLWDRHRQCAKRTNKFWFSSVHFSCSVMSDSLWPHGLQHSRFPYPTPTPGACSNSCALSRWCHPTISSSVIHFSSRLQSFPASASFPMSQFFASYGQSIGVSASASVLPMNVKGWFTLEWTGWIFL